MYVHMCTHVPRKKNLEVYHHIFHGGYDWILEFGFFFIIVYIFSIHCLEHMLGLHFILKAIYILLILNIIKIVKKDDKLFYKANKVSSIYLL